jgi:DNA-binding protein HU-beta/integration host factor subunit beta
MGNSKKLDLIKDSSKSTGLTQVDTKIVVDEIIKSIGGFLEMGKTIELRGFGTFYTKIRKQRPARNPQTGEVVPLLKRVVPLFKYSKEMKDSITLSLLQKDPTESKQSS